MLNEKLIIDFVKSLNFESSYQCPSAWIGHEKLANFLIKTCKPKTIVELGVHNGFSYFSFCQTVHDYKLETKCFGIDNWQGDLHASFYDEKVYEEVLEQNKKYHYFSELIKKDFNSALADFKNHSIDFLHIDGYHTYDAVKSDFTYWLPKCTKDALILFHDVNEFKDDFGVYKFFNELKQSYSHFTSPHAHGLGIITLSNNKNSIIHFLNTFDIQTNFSALLLNQHRELEKKKGLDKNVKQQTKTIEQQTKTIEQQTKTIEKLDLEIKKIVNSRSFIITKPLRFLGRILRGEFILAFAYLYYSKFVTFILEKIAYKFSFKFKSYINLKNIYKWSVEKKYFNYHFYNNKYVLNLDSWSAFKFYIEEGFLLNHNPSEKFSTILFYSLNPDILAQKINPLLYYFFNQLECENFIEKCANLIIDENGYETPEYEPNLILNSTISHKNVPKIFAFFLPGFHEDEFNNEFWGKGFTEWDNLKKNNKPLFFGHKYPLEPYKYYNLNDEKIIREQCKLAKKSGIDGFCIFLYFFPGNKFPLYNIVPKLVEILTEEGLEFCFLWANESWSRRWDGLDKDILIEQSKELTAEEINTYVSRISHFFRQKNYLTIDNKKYFAIYRPYYFKNSNTVIKQIKDEFKKEKIDVHLSACKSFSISQEILDEGEYDSITEYPPHQLNDNEKNFSFQKLNNNLTTLHCYKNLFLHYVNYVNYFKYKKKIFRTIIPSWDNTPRKGKKSNLFINYSSANFNKFLSVAISDEMKNNDKDKVIFINSWNEWGEGANIEPDKTYGYWKLNCISRIKNNFITSELHNSKSANIFNNDNIRLALVHIFYSNDFQYLLKLVKRYNNINFLVTIPKFKFNFEIPNLKNLIIKTVHNEERDFNVVYQSKFIKNLGKYKIISKIHFKRRDQTVNKKINLYETYKIVEDQLKINSTLNELESNKFISKSNWSFKDQQIHFGSNEYFLKKLCDDFKCDYSEFLKSKFISGGIWTILDNSLAYLDFVNNIEYSNFYLDSGHEPYDGSYCHALERFICFYVKKKNFQIMLL